MPSAKNLRPQTYVSLFLEVSFGALGNTLCDKGMKEIGAVKLSSGPAIWAGVLSVFASDAIWLGIVCLLLFMVCHMLVLSWADYSFVLPFSAVSYALVPLFAYLWFGEAVSAARWVGIGLILAGVFLISRTPPRTTRDRLEAEGAGQN